MREVKEERITTVSLKSNEELVTTVKSRHIDPPYIKIGSGLKSRVGGESINVLKELYLMSRPEQWFIVTLIDNIDSWSAIDPNIAYIDRDSLTQSEKQYIKVSYKKLESKGIVKRIKQNKYMINPKFIIPPVSQELAIAIWKRINGEES